MKKCPFCGADIEENAQFCLYCMTSLTEKEQILVHKQKKPQGLLILAAIVAAAIILLLLLLGRRDVQNTKGQTTDITVTTATTETTMAPTTQATTAPTVETTTETTEAETEPTQATTQPTTKPSSKPDRPTEPEPESTQPATQPTEPETQPTTQPTQPETEPTTEPTEPTTQPTTQPTEPGDPSHAHSFTVKKATYKFLATGADCVNPATYYYSCSCGAKGTDTFPSGNAMGHTIERMPGTSERCTTPGSTGGTYCTTCQTVITPPTTIPPSGHKFYLSSSTPTCSRCRTQGTFNIISAGFPAVSEDEHYQINSCSYYVYREGTNWVTLILSITNLHPSEETFALTVSLVSTDGRTMGSNPDNIIVSEAGETAYWWADVYIPSPSGTYVIYP